MLGLLDRIGTLGEVAALPVERRSAVRIAVLPRVTGVSARIIAPGTAIGVTTSRDAFLAETSERRAPSAERRKELDAAAYPFLTPPRATDLRDHADRDQFIAGLSLLLEGPKTTPEPWSPA